MKSPIRALLGKAAPKPPQVPVRYTSRASRFPSAHRTGAEAQMRAMETVGTVHAIVNRSAKAIAGVEWKLYRSAASGKPEDRQEVTSHAALDLWRKPNPFFVGEVFVEAGAQHKLLTGEQWWVIAHHPRSPLPLELWPVSPARMEPVPDPDRFLAGYMYRAPNGEEIALRLEDVIFIRTPHPSNPYRGISPIQPLLTDIDAARLSAEWNRNFFYNSAEPGGIIEVPGHLSDPEFDELRERWNEQHKGVANAHRVAILERGTWKDRKNTQREMEFTKLRSSEREIIREAMGFPKPMLGTVDDTNRANMEAADVMFSRWLVVPDLRAMRGALNQELLPMYGRTAQGLEFDFVSPVPEDREANNAELTAKTEAAAALIQAGFYAPDVRAALGLPEMAYGQPNADPDRELLIDLVKGAPLLAPLILPMLGFTLPERPAPALAPPSAPDAEPAEVVEARLERVLASVRSREDRPALVRGQSDGDADLGRVREDHAAALEQLLADWVPIEDEWIDALGVQVEAAVDDGDTEALAGMAVDSGRAAGVLRDVLAATAQQAADRMAEEAAAQGVTITVPDVDVTARLAHGRIVAWGDELAGVAAAVAALVASGLVASAAAEAVRRWMPGAVGSTVATAVKTFLRGLKGRARDDQLGGALHRAQTTGRFAALEAAPAAMYVADERNDGNTCQPCAEIDGTEWDSLAEAMAAYGAGPYHLCEGGIRCRGTVTARWE